MSELNKREMRTYRYGFIQTPFARATQNEDDEIGRCLRIAEYWRKVTFTCLAGMLVLFIFFFSALLQPQFTIVAASIFPNGFVRSTGILKPAVIPNASIQA